MKEGGSTQPVVTDLSRPEEEPMLYCSVCPMRLVELKCKLVCSRCGYFLSCSDYY